MPRTTAEPAANSRKNVRAAKSAPTRRKRKFSSFHAPPRAPASGAFYVKRTKLRESAPFYVKLTKFRPFHAAGLKFARAARLNTASLKSGRRRRFYDSFTKRRRFRQTVARPRASKKAPRVRSALQIQTFTRSGGVYFPTIISANTFASFTICAISMCSFGMWAQSISWHQTAAGIPARRKKAPQVAPPTPPIFGFMPG